MHIHNLFDNKRFFYDSIQYGKLAKMFYYISNGYVSKD